MGQQSNIYLQPLGGVAGDMFIAALLDTFPQHTDAVITAIRACGLNEKEISLSLTPENDCGLQGSRFHVSSQQGTAHHHTHFSDIKARLKGSSLPASVVKHALGIFQLLAKAEARIHNKEVDKVAFHEVGAWDSIADIVGAACLIDALDGADWYCDPLPLGGGTIESAHGTLPVPAPATALLMEGMPTFSDGHAGERVTPTGAAILRYVEPKFTAPAGRLSAAGMGFGSRRFEGMANLLRVLVFDVTASSQHGQVGVIEFEIDDQSPEELATGLEHLRRHPQVFDVLQQAVFAKKARLATHVRILCEAPHIESVAEACFEQTATLGVRWQIVNRLILEREMHDYTGTNGELIRVKTALRPHERTAKAELDDVRNAETSAQRRQQRLAAEEAILKQVESTDDDQH